mmetsp:Transcript_18330/g.22439  ORF Transcript_18330/g.22439 Transcript_18330/m.22439 type:complete len:623 (-) Transcript_18330:119-1987(-)
MTASARKPSHALTPFAIKAVSIASLGGILFGYDLGVISVALPQLTTRFNLTSTQQETVVSILYVGGSLGAVAGGSLCDFAGRKLTILLTDVMFITGALWLATSQSYAGLLAGRLVVGFAVAVSGCADVCYLHEISPPGLRGAIVSCNEACISLGFLLAYGLGFCWNGAHDEEEDVDGGDSWRILFGLSSVIALVQLLGMTLGNMPESPVWLLSRGLVSEAETAVMNIYECRSLKEARVVMAECGMIHEALDLSSVPPLARRHSRPDGKRMRELSRCGDVETVIENELEDSFSCAPYTNMMEREQDHESVKNSNRESLRTLVVDYNVMGNQTPLHNSSSSQSRKNPTTNVLQEQLPPENSRTHILYTELRTYHRQAISVTFLAAAQQFTGHANVLNFAPEIFRQAGLTDSSAYASTLGLGVVKFIVTCVVIYKIDGKNGGGGRRPLLLGGMSMICVGLLLLCVMFGYSNNYDENDYDPSLAAKAVSVVGTLGVVIGYATSFGPLTWLLTSEMFPSETRGRALGMSTVITYACAAMVSYTFLSLQETFQNPAMPFGVYLVLTLGAAVLVYFGIPETNTKSPDDIQRCMADMVLWKYFSGGGTASSRQPRQSSLELQDLSKGVVC